MICGIGIDSVEISRVAKSMERPGWLERLFTIDERNSFQQRNDPPETVAGRFAAKEAVSKALGFAMSLADFIAIEIRMVAGRPAAQIGTRLKNRLGLDEKDIIHLSISHDKGRALAVALWERRE